MCGRFSFSANKKVIEARFNLKIADESYMPRYNCAPSQMLAVISNQNPYQLSYYKWGMIPYWTKTGSKTLHPINAKSETLMDKPMFKNAFFKRRCLIPADGFFEWQNTIPKKPFRFMLKTEEIFCMAGIWETWKNENNEMISSFCILTTTANALVRPIHERMPVILEQENEIKWLTENNPEMLLSMLKPLPVEAMQMYAISPLVNSPKNDTPEILTALPN